MEKLGYPGTIALFVLVFVIAINWNIKKKKMRENKDGLNEHMEYETYVLYLSINEG